MLATGELQPLGAERPIKAPFGDVMNQILVREGQNVTVGQALLRLDPQVSEKRAKPLRRSSSSSRSVLKRKAAQFRLVSPVCVSALTD